MSKQTHRSHNHYHFPYYTLFMLQFRKNTPDYKVSSNLSLVGKTHAVLLDEELVGCCDEGAVAYEKMILHKQNCVITTCSKKTKRDNSCILYVTGSKKNGDCEADCPYSHK